MYLTTSEIKKKCAGMEKAQRDDINEISTDVNFLYSKIQLFMEEIGNTGTQVQILETIWQIVQNLHNNQIEIMARLEEIEKR